MLSLLLIFILVFSYLARSPKVYLLIFFFVLTNGFQLLPSTVWFYGLPFIDKPTDVLLLATGVILLLDVQRILPLLKDRQIQKYFQLIFLMVLIGSLVAYAYDVPFSEQLRILRTELVPIAILPLLGFPHKSFKFIFDFLFKLTIFQSILFLLQIILGRVLLFTPFVGTEIILNNDESTGIVRYYNSPAFLILFFYYATLLLKEKKSLWRGVVFLILLSAIIGPLHRGMMASVFFTFFLYNLIYEFKISKLIISTVGLIVLVVIINTIPGLNSRFLDAWEDLSNLKGVQLAVISDRDSTFAFRLMHLIERIQYISENTGRLIFGIGLIPEDVGAAQKLPLMIGNYSDKIGGIKKIDTADIAWSALLLRFGLFGIFVFVFFLRTFFRRAKAHRQDKIIVALLMYVIAAILGSFTGAELTGHHLRLLILLSLVIYIPYLNHVAKKENTQMLWQE